MEPRPSASNTLITKLVLLIAVMAIMTLYFWGHNVEHFAVNLAHGLSTVLRIALDMLTVGAIVAVGGGIGRRILHSMASLTRPERVALQSTVGLGIISIGALIMGLLGVYTMLMWVVLGAAGLVTLPKTVAWLLDFRAIIGRAFRPATGWERFVVFFATGLLLAAFMLALAPPFKWDGMTYHLVIPHRYLEAGRIAAHADNHFFGFPQGMEALYGLAMALFGSDSTPAMLHFVFGLLGLAAMAGLVRRYSNPTTGYTSVLLIMSSFSIWLLFGWPYVDLAMLCYGAVAVVAATQWNREKTTCWLVLCGVLAGMALSVKYTGAGLVIALGVFIVLRQPQQFLRNGLIYAGAVLLTFLPWMVKGMLLYDNPVYPYIFDGLNWDSLRTTNFSLSGSGLLSGDLWWHLPILPFAATVFGIDNFSPPPYAFSVGAWLLTLPFALVIGWKVLEEDARRLAADLSIIGIALLAFWMLLAATSGIGAQPRLMLVGAPVAAGLGALALHSITRLPRKPLNVSFIVHAMIAFSLLLGLFDVVYEVAKTRVLDFTAGTITEDTYLQTNLGVYYPAIRHLAELPEGSTVQFMWEPKSYYCPDTVVCIPDVLFDHWARPILKGTDPGSLMRQWQDEGVDYLLVYGMHTEYNVGYDFWLAMYKPFYEANMRFPEVLEETMTPIWSDGFVYTLYEWKAR